MERESRTQNAPDAAPGEFVLTSWRVWVPAAVAVVVAAIGIGLLAYDPVAAGVAQAAACPASDSWPAPSAGSPLFTDNNVAEFVGGNYRLTSATGQAEGLVVVLGNATFGNGRAGESDVGTVAVGSRVDPSPGSLMLAVGGTLRVLAPSQLRIGAASSGGGSAAVGGDSQGSQPRSISGVVRADLGTGAVDQFSSFKSQLVDESARLHGLPATGSGSLAGSTLYFTGDGRSARQVFDVEQHALSRGRVFDFKDVPAAATIVVNVTGNSPTLSPSTFDEGGVDIGSPPGTTSASLAAHLLWNFENATRVSVAGTTPVLGSILVAGGSVTIADSVEGRVYVAADLTTLASNASISSYPWLGDSTFTCQSQPIAVATAGSTTKTPADPGQVVRDGIGTLALALAAALLAWWLIARARRKRTGEADANTQNRP